MCWSHVVTLLTCTSVFCIMDSLCVIFSLIVLSDSIDYVVRGQQLDINFGNDRVLAIIQHEGTKEHA